MNDKDENLNENGLLYSLDEETDLCYNIQNFKYI